MFVRGRRRVLLLAALCVSGCLSPTLPLPPPSRPDTIEGPDQQGLVHVEGTVPGYAEAFLKNDRTGVGVFQQTGRDGRYSLSIAAQPGDYLQLWYEQNGDESPFTDVYVPGASDAGAD